MQSQNLSHTAIDFDFGCLLLFLSPQSLAVETALLAQKSLLLLPLLIGSLLDHSITSMDVIGKDQRSPVAALFERKEPVEENKDASETKENDYSEDEEVDHDEGEDDDDDDSEDESDDEEDDTDDDSDIHEGSSDDEDDGDDDEDDDDSDDSDDDDDNDDDDDDDDDEDEDGQPRPPSKRKK